jgi:Na+/proline symporter
MPEVAAALTVISVLFTGALVVLQLIIGGLIIDQITGVGFATTAGLLTFATLAYLIWGGYRALLYTDVVQAIVLFIFSVGLAWFLWRIAVGSDPIEPLLVASEVPLDLIGLTAGGFFAIIGGPEIWQRVVTCRTDLKARLGLVTAGFVMLAWGGIIILGGTIIHQLNPSASENDAFFVFLGTDLPGWLLGGILVAILVAIMSTADTELFAATVIARKQLHRGREPLRGINKTRASVIGLALCALGVSLTTQSVLDIYFWLVYLTFIGGPVALAVVLNRGGKESGRRRAALSAVILLSTAIFGYQWYQGLLVSWYPILIAAFASIPLLIRGEAVEDSKP